MNQRTIKQQPETPRHKKKAVRGSVPIYCRLDPKSEYAKWMKDNRWSAWKRYRNTETAQEALADLERKHTAWQFTLEKPV